VRRYSRPVRGVIQFIKALKREGFKLCLATGTEKPIVQKVLSILGIPRVFDVMITGNECALSKPNPQVYLLAIKAVGVPAREILVIEDSAAGVLAAKQAGLRCVAITTTHAARQLKQADVVVRSFKELHRLLQKASR
jgi:HAD superfamily hydrolase (TIGR01509 family)